MENNFSARSPQTKRKHGNDATTGKRSRNENHDNTQTITPQLRGRTMTSKRYDLSKVRSTSPPVNTETEQTIDEELTTQVNESSVSARDPLFLTEDNENIEESLAFISSTSETVTGSKLHFDGVI